MQILRRESWVAGTLVLMLATVASCSKTQNAPQAPTHGHRPPVNKGSGGTAFDMADMVSAVTIGKASSDVDLKFALRDPPAVGVPVDIEVAVIPAGELDQVFVTFSAPDGLEISKGATMEQVEHPEAGAPLSHTLTIVAQRDGVFYVSATVLVDSASSSITHSFSIPVIAGTGITGPASAAPASATRSQ